MLSMQFSLNAVCLDLVSEIILMILMLEFFWLLQLGGYYYGKIKFPPEYPYKPPGILYVLSC